MKFTYKTAEEIAAMSAEEQNKYLQDKNAHEANVRKEEIEKALQPLKDAQDTIKEDLSVMKESLKGGVTEMIKNQMYNVIKENHAKIVEAVKEKKDFPEFAFNVAAMHMTNNGTVSNVSGLNFPASTFEVDNDIFMIKVPENFILRVIRNSQRAKVPQTVIKTQQVPSEGAVAVVAEGAVKPLLQYKFQRTSTSRKKYAGRIEWTEEFEMDFEALLDAIVDMFERDVITAWQDDLINIITTNATAYVSSSLDGTLVSPDNGLAIVAAAQKVKALGYTPNFVLMNPVDIDAAVYTQDADGNFQLKPYIDASGNRIAGITVIPSLKIDEGTALVGDFSIYKEIHSAFIMRRGQYGDQFIENEYTLVGEVFSVLNAAPASYTGIININLATVKAALKVAP